MTSHHRILLAGVVLVIGVCAAIPFHRHFREQEEVNNRDGENSPWQTGKSQHVPLQVRVHTGESPATGLYDDQPAALKAGPDEAVVTTAPRIDAVDLPPKLPVAFPVDVSTPPGAPSPVDEPENGPRRVIRHTIKDDDTLRSLAQRYLGDANRYGEIFDANPQLVSPTLLPIGEQILIPTDSPRPQ